MEARQLLDALHVAEKLKDATRHCYTSGGRHESVAEHSWRLALMAYFLRDDFPEADMDKVVRMCLIHDLGEAFTGDIPTFLKTDADRAAEDSLLSRWVASLPEPFAEEMAALYAEMEARQSLEARIYKALDGLEALIQHNESDLSTWSENEYELNLHYCDDRVGFSPALRALREAIREDTIARIAEADKEQGEKLC
jgi:putative hydrolase of HD superfamily